MIREVKTIVGLSGSVSSKTTGTMPAQRTSITDFTNPRWLKLTSWTSEGLTIERGPTSILIPFDEIIKLAESLEPAFVCPEELKKGYSPAPKVIAND